MTAPNSDYFLASSEEIQRLTNQHNVIKTEMGGPQGLVLAPIDLSGSPLRILDSATADGLWIRDLASTNPTIPHQFLGTDIDASNFPVNPPANQTYHVQDILKTWPGEWKHSFDLVHQRLALAGGGPQQQQVVQNLADLVKPGGWMQLIEPPNNLPEDTGPGFRAFVTVIEGIFSAMGASPKLGEKLPVWMEGAGLVDVQDQILDIKLGAKNPNSELAGQSVWSTTVAARGLAGFAGTLPEGTIPLTAKQVRNMPEELNKELADFGAVYPFRVVWGRKPTD